MPVKKRLNRKNTTSEYPARLVACVERADKKGALRMQYATVLDKLKKQQEKDLLITSRFFEELVKPPENPTHQLYQEIANYLLNLEPLYLDFFYPFYLDLSDSSSIISFLHQLKHSITDDGYITCFWRDDVPVMSFENLSTLIGVKSSDIIDIKDFVNVMKSYRDDYEKQMLLHDRWASEDMGIEFLP